ncbi:MAG: PD40 domain-containing protein [Flavobacteriales bacterium]|nr:PD40 domain-containing protein [Flavobacteriales bacterium]
MALKHLVACLLLTAFGACGGPAADPDPVVVPALRVAYNVYTNTPEDNYEIFVRDLDGKNAKNITNTPGVDWVYSAHEDELYFLSDRDTCHRCYFLYEMDANGNNVRRISDHQMQDSWMSARMDGGELIVDPKGIRDTAFFRIDRNGRHLDTLYHGLAYANDPCFSPDGQRIVFRGAHAKFKQDTGYHDELYVMNTDDGGVRQLTHYPTDDTTAQWWQYHAGPPRWEPNHDRITYCSHRKGNLSIFSIKPDGTDEKQITPDGFDEDWHAWSPDGKLLVYSGTPVITGEERPRYDIFLMDMVSGKVTALAADTLSEQAPVFVRMDRRGA